MAKKSYSNWELPLQQHSVLRNYWISRLFWAQPVPLELNFHSFHSESEKLIGVVKGDKSPLCLDFRRFSSKGDMKVAMKISHRSI